jgi:hypothetical protein
LFSSEQKTSFYLGERKYLYPDKNYSCHKK